MRAHHGRELVAVGAVIVLTACGLSVSGPAALDEDKPDTGSPPAVLPPPGTPPPDDASIIPDAGDMDAADAADASDAGCTNPGLAFDGINDFVSVAADDALNMIGPFTVEAWIRPFDKIPGSETQIVSKHNDDNSAGWVLLIKDSRIEFRLYGRNGDNSSDKRITVGNTGAAYVQPDVWAHVAGTYDGTNLAVYYAGARKDQKTASDFQRRNTAGIMTIGRAAYVSSFFFEGEIDDVRVSSVDRYAGAATIPKPVTIVPVDGQTTALYRFDEASGASASNAAPGNPFAGTLGSGQAAPTWTMLTCVESR